MAITLGGSGDLADAAVWKYAKGTAYVPSPILYGDLIILNARVTCAFRTSMEVQVDVFSEQVLTGQRQLTTIVPCIWRWISQW